MIFGEFSAPKRFGVSWIMLGNTGEQPSPMSSRALRAKAPGVIRFRL
jgi:hypothetical protein